MSKSEEAITRAALSEFARVGYEAATTKNIAKLSKTSQATLFRLFRSKERLFERCMEVSYYENQSSGEFAKKLLSLNFKEAVKGAVSAYITHVSDDHIRLVTYGMLQRPDLVRSSLDDLEAQTHLLASRIAQEQHNGTIRKDVDALHAADQLLSSITWNSVKTATLREYFEKVRTSMKNSAKRPLIFIDLWCSALLAKTPEKPRQS